MRILSGLMLIAILLFSGAALAEDAYYNLQINTLTFTDGALPTTRLQSQQVIAGMLPYAVLDGEGEAYLNLQRRRRRFDVFHPDEAIAIRAPEGRDVTGYLYFLNPDGDGMSRLAFTVPASAAKEEAKESFYQTKETHYQHLLGRNIPGAAWFRHQASQARNARTGQTDDGRVNRNAPNVQRRDELPETYALFTGGRAVSENLQLDRLLQPTTPEAETVDIASIPGITVSEMDWESLIEGLTPDTDPLAAMIPADQHALFFPNFRAFVNMIDEAKANGTPVLRTVAPRSEDAQTHQRYERQLCLSVDGLVRLLGPQVVASVAFTGSDPYLRTGTDVAILFEPKKAAALKTFLATRYAAAIQDNPEVKSVEGEVEGMAYTGVVSPDRHISSYSASLGNVIIVTNSLHQLRRLVSAAKGTSPAMASLPEYIFFRNRYPRGELEETVLLVMTDAAIRRWCSPQWRIAASRRTRAAAAMAELQALHLDALINKTAKAGLIQTDLFIPDVGEFRLTPSGVVSSVYGNLEFLTPIAEIPLTKVTEAEANAYQRWRDRYQRNWRQVFDPIAIRFSVKPELISTDLTVMPLVEGTEYNQFIDIARGVEIAPQAGDRHADTLLHWAMAINTDSQTIQRAGNFASSMAPGLSINPLGWLGQSIAVYVDDDPFWAELEAAEDADEFMGQTFHRLPVALHCEVKSALRLTAFLTTLRAFIEQTVPGMTIWEALSYKDQPYVKITPAMPEQVAGELSNLAVYYVATPRSFVITLSEDLLMRALDRQASRQQAKLEDKEIPDTCKPWLGANLCLQVNQKFLDVIQTIAAERYQTAMQRRSWGNIPILGEWRRLYPDHDPLELHEKFWNTRLVCPGGGTYVWNEEFQTIESTVYGHPGEPRKGSLKLLPLSAFASGNFGLIFENQGLRAKVMLERKAAKP